MPAPFQLSKSNRSDKAPGSAPGTPRTREETLTFRESLARIENKVGRFPGNFVGKPRAVYVYVVRTFMNVLVFFVCFKLVTLKLFWRLV